MSLPAVIRWGGPVQISSVASNSSYPAPIVLPARAADQDTDARIRLLFVPYTKEKCRTAGPDFWLDLIYPLCTVGVWFRSPPRA